MAACMLRQAAMSTFPAASICVYCVSAFSCSAVLAPPASIASLNASEMFVASSRLFVSGASCCTMPAIALDVVGRPSSALLILRMLAPASSAEYPRFFMTLGKLFIWSARLIALPMLLLTALTALPTTLCTAPAIAPALADRPESMPLPAFPPALLPAFSAAESNALAMALPTPERDGTTCT